MLCLQQIPANITISTRDLKRWSLTLVTVLGEIIGVNTSQAGIYSLFSLMVLYTIVQNTALSVLCNTVSIQDMNVYEGFIVPVILILFPSPSDFTLNNFQLLKLISKDLLSISEL